MQNTILALDSLPTATDISNSLETIRIAAPLIHNITNFVSMPFIANALLALGASPLMAHAHDELADIVKQVQALVINIGTLDSAWIESMELAMSIAQRFAIPIILDPVGAGASRLRTETANKFLYNYPLAVVRGNASEIIALRQTHTLTKGVEATHSVTAARKYALELAQEFDCTVVVSGETDFITNGITSVYQASGHPFMAKVTGMGCVATTVIAAFIALKQSPLMAALQAMTVMGISGERAAQNALGPGSFQTHFIDQFYHLTSLDLSPHLRISYAAID